MWLLHLVRIAQAAHATGAGAAIVHASETYVLWWLLVLVLIVTLLAFAVLPRPFPHIIDVFSLDSYISFLLQLGQLHFVFAWAPTETLLFIGFLAQRLTSVFVDYDVFHQPSLGL